MHALQPCIPWELPLFSWQFGLVTICLHHSPRPGPLERLTWMQMRLAPAGPGPHRVGDSFLDRTAASIRFRFEAHDGLTPRRGGSSGSVPCARLANHWVSDPTSCGTLV